MKNKTINKLTKTTFILFLAGIFTLESAVSVEAQDNYNVVSGISTDFAIEEQTSTVTNSAIVSTGSSINDGTSEEIKNDVTINSSEENNQELSELDRYYIDLFDSKNTYDGKVSVFRQLFEHQYADYDNTIALEYMKKYFSDYYSKGYKSLSTEYNSIKDMRKSFASLKKKINKFKNEVESNIDYESDEVEKYVEKSKKLKTKALKRYRTDAKKYYEAKYRKYKAKNYKNKSLKQLGDLDDLVLNLSCTVDKDPYMTNKYKKDFEKKIIKILDKYEKQFDKIRENNKKKAGKFAAKLAKKLGISYYEWYYKRINGKFAYIKDLRTGKCYGKNGKRVDPNKF